MKKGIPEGAISGKFSISANKQVYFSKGNLQYQASPSSTWRFAENQYDYVGDASKGNVYVGTTKSNNRSISETYTGWIDLFGWGTSGYKFDSGYGSAYQPWESTNCNTCYGPTDGTSSLTGYYANGDWGVYNAISNGGNKAGLWRTLTIDEWDYLLNTRTVNGGTGSGKSYTINVSVNSVSGTVLYPDDYTGSTYSGTNWSDFESAGCIFLPAAGGRNGTSTERVGSEGKYWSSTARSASYVRFAYFLRSGASLTYNSMRYAGNSVRLVYDINAKKHQYVDLGLPSGTKWATMNVGATSETDYGNYYMYGMGSRTYNSTDTPYTGTEDPLNSSVDTATQVWGGSWHMPTRAQMQELTDNTTYQWVTNYKGSGINGGLFIAQNGNSVFFPAAGYWNNSSQGSVGNGGYYWGSSPNGSDDACDLYFFRGYKVVGNGYREYGYSVRPVIG